MVPKAFAGAVAIICFLAVIADAGNEVNITKSNKWNRYVGRPLPCTSYSDWHRHPTPAEAMKTTPMLSSASR